MSDQWGAPTLAYDLAKAVKILLINIKNKKTLIITKIYLVYTIFQIEDLLTGMILPA